MIRFASLTAAAVLFTAASLAGSDVQLPAFTALNVHSGAHAVVHYGATQRVTVLKGDMKNAVIRVKDGSLELSACNGWCFGNHELEVEIVAPKIDTLTAHSGGAIKVEGNYPKKSSLNIEAHSGGAVEASAIPAENANVQAHSGGSVHVKVLSALNAQAHSGGSISYAGRPPHVASQTNSGGSIHGE